MKSVRLFARQATAALALLAACEPAFADSGTGHGFAGAALLWVLVCGATCWLLRVNLRYHRHLGELEQRLARERAARAASEQALTDSHGIVCKLVLEQAGVRDSERSRIARDIHDELGQNLLALRIDLSLMQVATNGMHPAIHQKVGLMASNLDLAIRSLRAVINNLRPLALGDGLQRAIERQLVEFTRLSGIEHSLDIGDGALDGCDGSNGLDAILYRVLQESLSNVARHARASRVRVNLARNGGCVHLRVQDDGVGFQGPAGAGRCGLAGMRERASAAGGRFKVSSSPGGGTTIELALPLPSPQPAPSATT